MQLLNHLNTYIANSNESLSISTLYPPLKRGGFTVEIDKEMVNLLRYQRAYEAAAKVIQTSDEILKTTLSLKS